MTNQSAPRSYFVVFFEIDFASVQEAMAQEPDAIAEHIARSKQFQAEGKLLMAGAFLDQTPEGLQTMGVLTSREAAEAFAQGDPFVVLGRVRRWYVREWANMLR